MSDDKILKRWEHIKRACYDTSYPYYHFFGAHGIEMSSEFQDFNTFKDFCIANAITDSIGSYTNYLIRKDKSKGYSPSNCTMVSEKALNDKENILVLLDRISFTKSYCENHGKGLQFLSAYTRYYVYDFNKEDAILEPFRSKRAGYVAVFSPYRFYISCATPSSVSFIDFSKRYQSLIERDANVVIFPHELLKPGFKLKEYLSRQGR